MLIYDDLSKNVTSYSIFFLLFWKILSYLVYVPSFKSINRNFLSLFFHPCLPQRLRGQNRSAGIGLIEFSLPSDTLNYKPYFKHSILRTILRVFLLFIFVWSKIFSSKNWAVFYVSLICCGVAFGVTVLRFSVTGARCKKLQGITDFFAKADIIYWK